MKKSLVLATTIFAVGNVIALIARLAGYASFNALSVSAAAGSVFVCSLVLMTCSDYARQPRFRVRRDRNRAAEVPTVSTPSTLETASDWSYTTRSA